MTETDWLKSTDPQAMLAFLRDSGKLSERKARLFAVACCRRIWHLLTDERSRRAVEVAEGFADGQGSREELEAAQMGAETASTVAGNYTVQVYMYVEWGEIGADEAWQAARAAAAAASNEATQAAEDAGGAVRLSASPDAERVAQVNLLRCIFGPLPFRPLALAPSIRTWNDGVIVMLATAIYEERSLPEGTLDGMRLGVLSDALEEAGCDNADILAHLRGPGPHTRGCWCLDLLLDKK